MALWQALVIGVLGYFGVNRTPWFFGQAGGHFGIGSPIVACSIMGIMFGDVQSGVIIGASLQALYLGQIQPGGALPSDKGFATFIGGSLAIASGGGVEAAIAMAVPLGVLGVVLFQFFMTTNAAFAHKADKYAEAGDGKGIARTNIMASIPTGIVYILIYTLANYFGVDFVQSILGALPAVVTEALGVAAKIIPAVGFAMLLKYTLLKGQEWLIVFFIMGFVLVKNTGFNIVSLVLFSCGIAVLFIAHKITGQPQVATETAQTMSIGGDDDEYEE